MYFSSICTVIFLTGHSPGKRLPQSLKKQEKADQVLFLLYWNLEKNQM